jgi:hypothetical protein
MPTYEFKTIEEFVSYLDTGAKFSRGLARNHHERSHRHASEIARASAFEDIAAIVRNSNLVVVNDYMRAALSKAVG